MSNVSHDYMEQCPYCKKFLLYGQRQEHKCETPFNDVREIPVMFFFEGTNEKGEGLVVGRGYDGIIYRLVKCKNPLSHESHPTIFHKENNPILTSQNPGNIV